MLILTAENVTGPKKKKVLARPDGTADYEVWVGINQHCIHRGKIAGHVRASGAAQLLRLIADDMEAAQKIADSMPFMAKFVKDSALLDIGNGIRVSRELLRDAAWKPSKKRKRK